MRAPCTHQQRDRRVVMKDCGLASEVSVRSRQRSSDQCRLHVRNNSILLLMSGITPSADSQGLQHKGRWCSLPARVQLERTAGDAEAAARGQKAGRLASAQQMDMGWHTTCSTSLEWSSWHTGICKWLQECPMPWYQSCHAALRTARRCAAKLTSHSGLLDLVGGSKQKLMPRVSGAGP